MIRRDYILRSVEEMVQALVRVVFLKHRQEYQQALKEIDAALRGVLEPQAGAAGELALDDWIALCRRHQQASRDLMVSVAGLLYEQGDVLTLQGNAAAGHRSSVLALGLLLEALLGGETFVSAELIAKVDQLLDATGHGPLSPPVFRRLILYLAARGRFAQAEDILFEWLKTGDAAARAEGEAFYQRLLELDDAALAQGNLPRAEVEQGLRELKGASSGSSDTTHEPPDREGESRVSPSQ